MNAATGTICRCAVMRWMLAPLAAGLIAFAPRAAPADQRVELHSRDGVVQAIDFIPVADPVATVILFPGGGGVIAQSRKNFVVRVRHRFADHGFNVAVADAPSDQSGRMGAAFRASAQQAQDVAAIIAFVRSKAAVPVWLIGTSMGTISAANAAARLGPPQVAGVVLTSSVWSGGMNAVPIAQIAVPVLVVHNRDDRCPSSPYPGAEQAMAQLTAAPAKELIAVAGGASFSRDCGALSPHGYYKIENQVVAPIIRWIEAHPPAP